MVTLLGIDRMNAIRMPWNMPLPKSWLTKGRVRYEVISLVDFGNNQDEIYHGFIRHFNSLKNHVVSINII